MRRGAHQEILCLAPSADKSPRVFDRQTPFAEMNSAGAERPSDVQPVVQEDAATRRNSPQGLAQQFRERPSGKILFAKLDPVDAGARRHLHPSDERFTLFVRRDFEASAVGHVAQRDFTGWRRGVHGQKPPVN